MPGVNANGHCQAELDETKKQIKIKKNSKKNQCKLRARTPSPTEDEEAHHTGRRRKNCGYNGCKDSSAFRRNQLFSSAVSDSDSNESQQDYGKRYECRNVSHEKQRNRKQRYETCQ